MIWIAVAIVLQPLAAYGVQLGANWLYRRFYNPAPFPGVIRELTAEEKADLEKQRADAQEMADLTRQAMKKIVGRDEPWQEGGQ